MKRKWKRGFFAAAAFLLAFGVGSQLLLNHLLHGPWLPRKVQEKLSDLLETPVRVNRLSGSIWGRIRAEELQIDSPQTGAGQFLEMDQALIEFSWRRLFQGELGRVTLVRPRLTLVRNAEGEWNLPPRLLKTDEGAASSGISLPELGIQQGSAALIVPGATFELNPLQFSLRHRPPSQGIQRYRIALDAKILSLDAPLEIRGELQQDRSHFRADIALSISDIALPALNSLLDRHTTSPLTISSGEAGIRSTIHYVQDEIRCSWELDIGGLNLRSATRSFVSDTIHVAGKCKASVDRGIQVEQTTIEVPALGRIELRGTIPLDLSMPFNLQTDWTSAPVNRLTESLGDWLILPIIPKGTLDLILDATGVLSSHAAFGFRGDWKDFQMSATGADLIPLIPPLEFEAYGRIARQDRTLEIETLKLACADLFSASASALAFSATEGLGATGILSAFIPDLSRALFLAKDDLPSVQIESASGSLYFTAPLQFFNRTLDATPSLRLCLSEAQSAWGALQGLTLVAHGTIQDRNLLGGHIKADLDVFSSNSVTPFRFEKADLEQSIQSQGPQGYSGDLDLLVQNVSIPASTAFSIPLQEVSIAARLRTLSTAREWALDAGRIAAKGLPQCAFSAAFKLDENPSASVRFQTGPFDLASLYAAGESSLPLPWQGWLAEGTGSLGLAAEWQDQPAESFLKSSATAEIASFTFFSADAMKAGSNLNANISVSAMATLPDGFSSKLDSPLPLKELKNLDWKAQIGFQGDELLYDTLYQDLNGIDFAVASRGLCLPHLDRIDYASANVSIHPLGEIAIAGSASNLSSTPAMNVALQASQMDLKKLHDRFIREGVLKDYVPSLSGIAPEGIVDATIAFMGNRVDWQTQGLLELERCDLQWPSSFPVEASGVQLHLPFRLASRKERASPSLEDFPPARLKYQGIHAGPLVFGPGELVFILADNGFRIPEPVSLAMAGGILSIHELEIEDLRSSPPHLIVHADATGIRMESITRNLALGAVPGLLSANLPRLETLEGNLISDGPAVLKVFDGEVLIAGLQVANYAASDRTIRFSADLKGINLLPLTSVLQYGQASGIIQGYIRDFSWGPIGLERFDVSIESVSRRGIPQEISVDLIEVITESGRGLGPAERAILRRSDLYKYNRLGLAAQLKDDRLTIRGTIPRKEAPLFMEGAAFGGINIALYPPPHGIAFEQYIEYLKRRIKQIKSSGGPKIE